MIYKIKLKNAKEEVLIGALAFDFFEGDPYFKKLNFLKNLRKHSSGCAVFQKTWKKADGGYKTETIYLHKMIAEKFGDEIDKGDFWFNGTTFINEKGEKGLVGAKDTNKLNCRFDNLVVRSRSVASRKRKTSSKVGYTGVYQEHNRYRAVISVNRKSVHIGMYGTAEEAALAYNQKSLELYGRDGKVNIIKSSAMLEKERESATVQKV